MVSAKPPVATPALEVVLTSFADIPKIVRRKSERYTVLDSQIKTLKEGLTPPQALRFPLEKRSEIVSYTKHFEGTSFGVMTRTKEGKLYAYVAYNSDIEKMRNASQPQTPTKS